MTSIKYHKLRKYNRHYDLQEKIFWHDDLKVLSTSCFHL